MSLKVPAGLGLKCNRKILEARNKHEHKGSDNISFVIEWSKKDPMPPVPAPGAVQQPLGPAFEAFGRVYDRGQCVGAGYRGFIRATGDAVTANNAARYLRGPKGDRKMSKQAAKKIVGECIDASNMEQVREWARQEVARMGAPACPFATTHSRDCLLHHGCHLVIGTGKVMQLAEETDAAI